MHGYKGLINCTRTRTASRADREAMYAEAFQAALKFKRAKQRRQDRWCCGCMCGLHAATTGDGTSDGDHSLRRKCCAWDIHVAGDGYYESVGTSLDKSEFVTLLKANMEYYFPVAPETAWLSVETDGVVTEDSWVEFMMEVGRVRSAEETARQIFHIVRNEFHPQTAADKFRAAATRVRDADDKFGYGLVHTDTVTAHGLRWFLAGDAARHEQHERLNDDDIAQLFEAMNIVGYAPGGGGMITLKKLTRFLHFNVSMRRP